MTIDKDIEQKKSQIIQDIFQKIKNEYVTTKAFGVHSTLTIDTLMISDELFQRISQIIKEHFGPMHVGYQIGKTGPCYIILDWQKDWEKKWGQKC